MKTFRIVFVSDIDTFSQFGYNCFVYRDIIFSDTNTLKTYRHLRIQMPVSFSMIQIRM